MFKHDKELLHNVRVDGPNPTYAAMLVEQLGGGNGELTAAMQYIGQAMACTDPAIKDLLMDIGSEEISHMEIVATTVKLLNGDTVSAKDVTSGTAEMHVVSGTAPLLVDSSGVPWTAAYVNVTGDLITDLTSDAAAELRAKVVYEYLYRQIQDGGVRDVIDFLLNREEAHNMLFQEAMQRIKGTGAMKDFGTTENATQYFNLSTPGRYFRLEENDRPTMPGQG
ncbi:MAG TPA: manganese catalase family protein, partial [Bacillota bacterium]